MKIKQLLTKSLLTAAMLCIGAGNMWGQASYNHSYTVGATADAGGEYFLYNIGSGKFLTGGRGWGTQSAGDNAGKVVTLEAATNGFKIKSAHYSANGLDSKKEGYLANVDYPYADRPSGNDNGDFVFTAVSVDGYTNAYTINCGENLYLYYNTDDTNLRLGAYTNNNYYHWILVPKATRDAAGDFTYYLQNQGFNRPWENVVWKFGESANLGDDSDSSKETYSGNKAGGWASNSCAEVFHKAFDVYQTISETVPNGKYKVYAQAFYRQDDNGTGAAPTLYANNDNQNLAVLNANGEGTTESMDGASAAFTTGQYVNQVTTIVSNGSLKVGISATQADQWVIWDNFAIDYVDPWVSAIAEEFTSGGTMTANKWYYYTVPSSTTYIITAGTELNNIIYTTNGDQLKSVADEITDHFSASQALTAGRVYIKSSSEQTLTFTDEAVITAAKTDCKSHETSAEFATYIDGGTYASAAEVYAAHTAWQITQAKESNSTDYSKVIIDNAVTKSAGNHFWGNLIDNGSAPYAGAPDNFYLSWNENAEYSVWNGVYGLPAGKYSVKTYTYSSMAGNRNQYIARISPWGDINTEAAGGSREIAYNQGWVETTSNFTLSASDNLAFGFYAAALENRVAGIDNWRLELTDMAISVTSAGWATLYTPYALDFTNATPSGLKAYTATLSENTVTLAKVDNVPANTGVVLKGDANTYYIPVIASSSTDKGSMLGNATEATAATEQAPIYILKLNDDNEAQFMRATSGSLGAGKAYLPVGNSGAKALTVVFADDVTGIANVNAAEVAQPTKRIVNGQLVIENNGKRYNAAGAEF